MKITKAGRPNPIRIYNKNNKKCSVCKKPMVWIEGLLGDGSTNTSLGKYCCEPCKLFHKIEESRAIKRGLKIAKRYNIATFKLQDLNQFDSVVQLGILRELQHGKNGYLNCLIAKSIVDDLK